jgi:thiosulfate/3-mercaptopyruvate sulfurtransferase
MSGLVSPEWLERRLGDSSLVLLDVSFFPLPRAAHAKGHIPGAHHVFWKDLCWHSTDRQFPSPETMATRLAAVGVGEESTLVLIGDPFQFATYAYWVITMCGLENRAVVLDGGHQTWAEQGRPMTLEAPAAPVPATLRPGRLDESARVGRDEVLAGLGDSRRVLIDLRSGEEYRGERVAPTSAPFDHGAERAGHIPGARHLFHERLLRGDGTFKDPDEIEAEFVTEGATADRDVVTYCRLSHRASLGWFALTRLGGRRNVRVYDGSWTEWGSMVGVPIER